MLNKLPVIIFSAEDLNDKLNISGGIITEMAVH